MDRLKVTGNVGAVLVPCPLLIVRATDWRLSLQSNDRAWIRSGVRL